MRPPERSATATPPWPSSGNMSCTLRATTRSRSPPSVWACPAPRPRRPLTAARRAERINRIGIRLAVFGGVLWAGFGTFCGSQHAFDRIRDIIDIGHAIDRMQRALERIKRDQRGGLRPIGLEPL